MVNHQPPNIPPEASIHAFLFREPARSIFDSLYGFCELTQSRPTV